MDSDKSWVICYETCCGRFATCRFFSGHQNWLSRCERNKPRAQRHFSIFAQRSHFAGAFSAQHFYHRYIYQDKKRIRLIAGIFTIKMSHFTSFSSDKSVFHGLFRFYSFRWRWYTERLECGVKRDYLCVSTIPLYWLWAETLDSLYNFDLCFRVDIFAQSSVMWRHNQEMLKQDTS